MNNLSETKQCQNCKKAFIIEPDDFVFYDKIKVPPPTFCPECRMVRRMLWRNERNLYKRACDLCKIEFISIYQKYVPFPVYCKDCWYGDGWDARDYSMSFDADEHFFKQLKQLFLSVPRIGIWQRNNSINSTYSNMTGESKNVYLSFSVISGCENIYYSKIIDNSKNIFDSCSVKDSDKCYENFECEKNYNCQFLYNSKNCIDSYYCFDCVNCSNCFLSSSLRNKQYCILNKQYSKEDYFNEIQKINFGSIKVREDLYRSFLDLKEKSIHRFANIYRSVNSTGDNLTNTKECKKCFEAYNVENVSYSYRIFNGVKDSMDFDLGQRSELMYEYSTGALNCSNVRFSYACLNSIIDAEYVDSCLNSSHLFGCFGIKNSEYCILNKKYSKDEYEKLRNEIVLQLKTETYTDELGHLYTYGEFFPVDFCPFSYNESLAQDYFPITKLDAQNKGYRWVDEEKKNTGYDVDFTSLEDDIKSVNENIVGKTVSCSHSALCNHQCTNAFRITSEEYLFYKTNNIPIPTQCPNCRYYERVKFRNPLKLWHRQCTCDLLNHDHIGKCSNEFETSYAPDRPEKVYCEKCYQKEVL